jgi:murein DD-endopeptidase MepM/ murein hydrolase activator NlpD/lipopolysaccharide export system protein LptA
MKQINRFNAFSKVSYGILLISLLIQLSLPQTTTAAAPAALGTGGCAVVSSGGVGLNVRSGPGTSYSVVGSLSDGTVVKITGGPTNANGYTWWQHDHGGWSVGSWLVDTSCPGGGGGGGGSGNIQLVDGLQFSPSSPQIGQSTSAYYKARNNGSASITFGHLGVKCRRNSDDANYDYYWYTNVTLSPGQDFTYNANRSFDQATSYWCTANYEQNGNWNDVKWSNGSTNYITINVQNTPPPPSSGNLVLIQDLSVSTTTPQVNQSISGSFRVKNTGGQAITIGHLGIQGRLNGDVNSTAEDFNWITNLTLQPGEEYAYSSNRSIDIAGSWTLRPNYEVNGSWSDVHRDNGTVNTVWITVQDTPPSPGNLVLIQDLSVSTTTPQVNQSISGSFRVKNTGGQAITIGHLGIQGRLNGDVNSTAEDFDWITNLTLQPGEEYAYSSNRSIDIAGNWTLRPNYEVNGSWSDVHRDNGTVNTVWITVQNAPPTGRNDLPTTNSPVVGYYYRLPSDVDVRGASSFSSAPYAHLGAGTVIKIIGGPRNQENATWWDLSEEEWGGGTGWFTFQNSSTPPSSITPRNLLPVMQLPTIGSYYRLPVDVDVRGANNYGSTPYAHLSSGTVIKIIDGPRDQDGVTWWDLSEEEWGGGTGWFTMGFQLPNTTLALPMGGQPTTPGPAPLKGLPPCNANNPSSYASYDVAGYNRFLKFPVEGVDHKTNGIALITSYFDHANPVPFPLQWNLFKSAKEGTVIINFGGQQVFMGCTLFDKNKEKPYNYNLLFPHWSPAAGNGKGDWLYYDSHEGYDYGTSGTAVAAASGTVVIVNKWDLIKKPTGLGNYVVIQHVVNGEVYRTLYAHLASMYPNVGDPINQGDPVGEIGGTGNQPVHLHFAVFHGQADKGYDCNQPNYNCVWYPTDPYGYPTQIEGDTNPLSIDPLTVMKVDGGESAAEPSKWLWSDLDPQNCDNCPERPAPSSTPPDYTNPWYISIWEFILKIFQYNSARASTSGGSPMFYATMQGSTGSITVIPGEQFDIQFTVQNSGVAAWSAISPFALVNIDDRSWAFTLDHDVSNGENYTWNIHLTAPNLPGTYQSTWIMQSSEIDMMDPMSVVVIVESSPTDTPTPTTVATSTLTPTNTPTPMPTPVSGSGLTGEYFDNQNLTNWMFSRIDPNVNFDWGNGSPDGSIGADTFSVRWRGKVLPQYSETYTFYTVSDDGVRLWVNGQLLIDNWTDHGTTENSGTINLTAGSLYDIQMEFYENGGGAIAKLLWASPSQGKETVPQARLYPLSSSPSGNGTGLKGEYYDNQDFTNFKLARTDSTVNFDWGGGSPDGSMGADQFSVRWTGFVQPRYSESYTFYTASDDGIRLWVNGQLLVDNWTDHGYTENNGTIVLSAGQLYDIRVDYYENGGGAIAKLSWTSASQAREIIPPTQLYLQLPPTPTAIFTPTTISTPSPTQTPTPTFTSTPVPTSTITPTQIVSPTATPTATITYTVTPSATSTPTNAPTATSTTSSPSSYFDNFSIYPPGLPLSGWVLRGTDGITPGIEEVGGSGAAYRLVNFPEVSWQYWDKWLLKSDLTLSGNYTVTVKMNFQNSVADRAGLTIAWDDSNWNRIDIQPNVYWDDIEFRVSYVGPLPSNVNVINVGTIPINANTDYWLRVNAIDYGPGQGQVNVYWSTDGVHFTQVITATGLATVTGLAGMSSAGPHMPHTHFDDFSVVVGAMPSPTPTQTFTPSPTAIPTFTVTPTATRTVTITPTLDISQIELLPQPWHLSANNGADELYQSIGANVLQGKDTLRVTYDLHGLTALPGDASAIIFDQSGWRYISLSDYGQNGLDGIQTVDIPLSDFPGLDLNTSVGLLHTRFWYSTIFDVDIISIVAYNSYAGTPLPAITYTPTVTRTPTPTLTPTETPTATNTSTSTPSETATQTLTRTPTDTLTATSTSTNTSTVTATNTLTPTATSTSTKTPTPTFTPIPTQVPVMVVADNQTKIYGDGDPALTFSYIGLVGGDTASDIDTPPTCSVSVPHVNIGVYGITCSGAMDNKYIFTYSPGNLTVSQRPLTITADALTKVYGSSDPVLSYQITSGTLQLDDALTGALNRAVGDNVGSYTITQGTLALSGNYTLTFVGANLTITQKSITVIADANTKVYGATDPALTYTFTPALVGTDAITGVLSRAPGENVGSYAITQGTLALSDNYDLTFVGANLTISAKLITVTADTKAKVYGATDPALTYTFSPALVGTDAFAGSLSRATGENIGTYPISQGSLALSNNYTLAFVGANLTITAKPITVTADARSKLYGATDPLLTYTFTPALASGDTFTGALSRDSGENVGAYAIMQGTLALSGNYALNFVSANLTITAKSITVSADAQSKVYGLTDPVLTYQITSGTLQSGDTLTGTLTRAVGENVGTYPIGKGTLTAGNNYNLTFVPANLTISAKPITVTADAKSKVYGATDPVLTYTFTPSLVRTDTFTGSLSRDLGENVGAYAITQGSLALSNNYTLTFVGANLTITKKIITVTANAQSKVYGSTDPALTYTFTPELASGDTFTGTLSRDSGENVGAYAITQGTLALSSNYTLTFVGASLTITKKTITVAADDQSKNYGDVDPIFTFAYSGFMGTDGPNDLATKPSCSVSMTHTNVGSYSITCSGGVDSNYAFNYLNGTLNIGKKTITVTSDVKSKVYGATDPTLTYTFSPALVGTDVFTGTPSRIVGENVGAYAITQGTLALSDNYILTFVSANLTITKKPITVTADAKSKVYGAADPTLTYTFTPPLVGTDTFTGVLSRATGENVGSYSITQGTLALSNNYTLNYVGSNLTITAKPITVTADAKSKVYGGTEPALTYQITSGTLQTGDTLTGTLTRAVGENVGTFAIGKGTLTAGNNYTVNFVGANLTITAKPITVTADANSKVYGATDPTLTYTFSPALVSGDTFTGLLSRDTGENVGLYAITQGSLALSSNYTLAFVGANLTITAKPITVTADAKTKVYGSSDPLLTYTFTPALVGTDAFTGSLSRDVGENVGTYAITQGTLALSSNYTLTYVGANFTITKKTITVTANAKTKVYGATDPTLTYTFSPALISGDTFTGVLSRATGENVGTYAIAQGTLALSNNYTLTYVSANLTISAKPITVTADAKSKVYGANDPASLTYTFSPALLGTDTFTGALSRNVGENVGIYAITQGTLALNGNYTLTYVGANLTITAKPITVTADAQSKVYGSVDPALTYTFTPALISGDAFTGALSRAPGENVGAYAITQGTLALSNNYTLTYVGANLTVIPADQTITVQIGAPTSAVLHTVFTVSANASSGLPVTYSASGACTNNGATFTVNTGTGTCIVHYDQAGSSNYNPAPQVTETVADGNDNPVDLSLSANSIAENQPAGTVVGQFTISDPDAGDTFTYSLVAGVGSTDNTSFTISGSQLKTAQPFNYEAKNTYSIRVRTTDSGGLFYEKSFSISVTDVNEPPADLSLSSNSVGGNLPIGTLVGSFTSTDPDFGNTFTYSLVAGSGNTDNASFVIDGNQLKTAAVLDATVKSSLSIRVRTTDNGGLSFEKVFTITVTPNSLIPILISPANGEKLHYNLPTFSWYAVGGVTSYQIQVSKSSSFSTTVINVTQKTANYPPTTPLPANTTLYWHVRTKSGTVYNAWSEVRSFTTANPPSVPILSAPANNALVTTLRPTFSWKASTLPTGTTFSKYEFQLDTSNTFGTATSSNISGSITNSSYIPTADLKSATTYYWRVRSWNTVGDFSGWSAVYAVKIAYAAPVLVTPASGSTVGSLKPTFTWNLVLGATSYKIQISTSSTFGTTVVNAPVTGTTYTSTVTLTSTKTYYWRVQAVGTYGPSLWSLVWSFITP